MTKTVLRVLFLFSLLTTPNVFAQTSNWTGTVDSSWNDAGNWDNGIPNVSSEIAVVGAPSPTVADINVDLGGLSVLSNGVLNVADNLNFDFDAAAIISNAGQINLGKNLDFQLVNVVTNNGTINVDGSGLFSDLELLTDATLDGTGSVFLNGTNARINDQSGTQTLTNGLNHTIHGSGNVGFSTIDIINNGLITADVSAETLIVDPNAGLGTLDNSGTLRAENGGILKLNGGVYNNSGGTIESSGGQVRFANQAFVNGGNITGSDVVVEAVANVEFQDTVFDATVTVLTNTDFGVRGTITNNGTITLDGSGSPTDVELATDFILDGTGVLTLNGDNARINDASGTQILTNGASHTINGYGNVGFSTIEIINNGLITANVSTETLIVDPNSTLGTFDNNGTLRAESGGILKLNGGVYNNDGGTIESSGGQIRFANQAFVNGGNITGSDVVVEAVANVEFSNTTFDATVTVSTNTDFGVRGTVTNNGTITIDGSGSPSDVELAENTTFDGTGTLVLDGVNARINDASGTQILTNGVNHTIRGSGNLGANTIDVVNNGTIQGDGNTTPLLIDPSSGAGYSGDGTVSAINGGHVQLLSASYDFTSGTVEAIGAGSVVDRTSAAFAVSIGSVRALDGGSVEIIDSNNGDVDISSNSANLEFTGQSFADIFASGFNGELPGPGASEAGHLKSNFFHTNSGEFRIADGLDFTSYPQNGSANNTGTIIAGDNSTFAIGPYSLGTVVCTNENGCAPGSLPVVGVLPFISTGILAGSGTIANAHGPGMGGLTPISTAEVPVPTLDADIHSDGIISPGEGVGDTATLTLVGYEIELGSSNVIEIEFGTSANDILALVTDSSAVDLNGALEVSMISGYVPVLGDSIQILTSNNGFTGTFDTETLPVLSGGLSFSVDYGASAVSLVVGGIAGDYNLDGIVDAADYTVWRDNLGSTVDLAADGNLNGSIDGGDYLIWAANFGQSAPSSSSAQAIPEPSSALIGLVACLGLMRRRHREQ